MYDPTTTSSTRPESAPVNAQPLYISPILKGLVSAHRPLPSPACETCPASIWFNTNDQLKCFCTRMHLMVWDDTVAPIMSCDGRELALLRLQQELEAMENEAAR